MIKIGKVSVAAHIKDIGTYLWVLVGGQHLSDGSFTALWR